MTARQALRALSPEARLIWNSRHPDYRGIREDGVPCVLYRNLDTGAVELWPAEAVAKELARRDHRCTPGEPVRCARCETAVIVHTHGTHGRPYCGPTCRAAKEE